MQCLGDLESVFSEAEVALLALEETIDARDAQVKQKTREDSSLTVSLGEAAGAKVPAGDLPGEETTGAGGDGSQAGPAASEEDQGGGDEEQSRQQGQAAGLPGAVRVRHQPVQD